MKKHTLLLLVLFIFTLVFFGIKNAPKGSSYIEWEKQMIQSGQMKVEKSLYFQENNGILKLKKQ